MSTSDMADMLSTVNTLRSQSALAGLTIDYRLVTAAQLHSQFQATSCLLIHTNSGGSSFVDQIKAQGYNYNTAAENVAAGQTSVSSVMTSWWNSPDHRVNIPNKDVKNVGFAKTVNDNFGTYWTRDFGSQLPFGYRYLLYNSRILIHRSKEHQFPLSAW